VSGLQIRETIAGDRPALFALFAQVVEEGGAFPTEPPVGEDDFERAWFGRNAAVWVAVSAGSIAGSYYMAPNYPGRAAHIANAGYMVHPDLRGRGIGRALVEHSIAEAPRHGFDALIFNLVFESNPARRLYERLGFREIGRVPQAIGSEDALVYWRNV
jgi:ribosomal protein S18 acetylase RimI-like enzyme